MQPKMAIVTMTALVVLAACSSGGPTTSDLGSSDGTAEEEVGLSIVDRSDLVASGSLEIPEGLVSTVSGPISGNRFVSGGSNLTSTEPIDIPLDGTPIWVVGVAGEEVPTFVVALEGGVLELWTSNGGEPERSVFDVAARSADAPPLVVSGPGGVTVIDAPDDASDLTYPALVDGRLIYITDSGGLVIAEGGRAIELEINALPDSRISVSDDGLVSVLAEPTDRYRHGVLGDAIEAGRLVVIDPVREEVVGVAVIDEPSVIEGVAAPWVDVDGDGTQELMATISNGDVGARLAVFNRTGDLVAEGEPVGRGNRWRNQLGAAPAGPDGEIEVIDVRVPHLGGVVEFFRVDGSDLVERATRSGFTSHRLGSRNLDMAFAADVTGDGRTDVILPTIDLDALGVITRSADDADLVHTLALPGRLTTNVGVAQLADGSVTLAVGTSEGVLRSYTG